MALSTSLMYVGVPDGIVYGVSHEADAGARGRGLVSKRGADNKPRILWHYGIREDCCGQTCRAKSQRISNSVRILSLELLGTTDQQVMERHGHNGQVTRSGDGRLCGM